MSEEMLFISGFNRVLISNLDKLLRHIYVKKQTFINNLNFSVFLLQNTIIMKTLIILFAFVGIFFVQTPAGPVISPETEIATTTAESVSFTLRNNSLKSIPLIIPGVMNPNLSPKSNSGVSLKIGQEILFRYKGKKRVLLVVSSELEGKKLDVAKLIREKKKEIDDRR